MLLPDDPNYHAPLSPSGAHRWMECPASVALSAELPEGPSSEAAEEGTRAHDYAEKLLKGEITPERADWEYDVGMYVDYCMQLEGEADLTLIEDRVHYDQWVPEGSGTADYISIQLVDQSVEVVDLKYGQGIKVDAPDNPQGLMYLLAVLQDYDEFAHFQELTFTIIQPRLEHQSSATYAREDVLAFGDRAKSVAQLIIADVDVPFNPGAKQCQWCPASGLCTAQHDLALEIARGEFQKI